MVELMEAITSWPSLLWVVIVFGFAPRLCLRLIVRASPRGDPRRAELIAELYAVPRIQRPLWVAEQLEVALFEGLGQRVSAGIRRLGLGFWAVLLALLVGATPLTFVLVTQSMDSTGTWVAVLGTGLAIASALLTLVMWRLQQPPRLRSRRDRTR
jgi:hypothetical protein